MKRQDAMEAAYKAHFGQKYGTEPYIVHPLRVMHAMDKAGLPEFVQVVAVLHDVSEDAPDSLDVSQLTSLQRSMLDAVTHRDGEPRKEYISRVIASGPFTVAVKMADIYDHLDHMRDLEKTDPARVKRLCKKYEKDLEQLKSSGVLDITC